MYGKAPKGGVVSAVNGQFYKGGQFTPGPTAQMAAARARTP